jgi:3-deoxy-7-phosphoheptulonate synthase
VAAVLDGADDRLVVIVGPCSVHDPDAALDYARRLAVRAEAHRSELVVVMRAYVEKPRTALGWTGLVRDPDLDGRGRLDLGLVTARRLLVRLADLGVPTACEFVDPLLAPALADAVSWGAIGARTAESQPHRQLASGLPMPVGVKNTTSGDLRPALDAIITAAAPHAVAALDDGGRLVVRTTAGNPHAHLVLRGGTDGPNHDPATVAAALGLLAAAGRPPRLVVDASHANSGRDPARQAAVVAELAGRVAEGEAGLAGVMVESNLVPGRQDLGPGPLRYGQSVTDPCLGWEETEFLLGLLAGAVKRCRRGR